VVVTYPGDFCRNHKSALAPYRQQLERLRDELGYRRYRTQEVGSELNLLIALLVVNQKTLDTLTRSDFEQFQQHYLAWYREAHHDKDGRSQSTLSRLENFLVRWGVIPAARVMCRYEERLAQLPTGPLHTALLTYLAWCEVRDAPSTIVTRQTALLDFFLWFQTHQPGCQRLDGVTRPIALAYAQHLKTLRDKGQRSLNYCNDLYRYRGCINKILQVGELANLRTIKRMEAR
jgi:hypothetical protein